MELKDGGVDRVCAYAAWVLAEEERLGSLQTALAVRDVAIALLAVNEACFHNLGPLEFAGALDRRQPGGQSCVLGMVRLALLGEFSSATQLGASRLVQDS